MPSHPDPLRSKFAEAARTPLDADQMLRRPPVAQRESNDLSDADMSRYLRGLEKRLRQHVESQGPLWLMQETQRVMRRWAAPSANHPAPVWAAPRNAANDALDYAAARVRARIAARLERFHGIALRHMPQDKQQPLRHAFSEAGSIFQKKLRQKQ